jgi:hypothetical protein
MELLVAELQAIGGHVFIIWSRESLPGIPGCPSWIHQHLGLFPPNGSSCDTRYPCSYHHGARVLDLGVNVNLSLKDAWQQCDMHGEVTCANMPLPLFGGLSGLATSMPIKFTTKNKCSCKCHCGGSGPGMRKGGIGR